MGLSADPQAFGPAAAKADLKVTGNAGGAVAGSRSGPLDPLIAALGRAVERSAQSLHHDADPDTSS